MASSVIVVNIDEGLVVTWPARRTGADGEEEAADGLTGYKLRFAETPDGIAIGNLTADFTESTTAGTYLASFSAASLIAALADYNGKGLNLVRYKGSTTNNVYQPVRIARRRRET